jgi:hypothetical protein
MSKNSNFYDSPAHRSVPACDEFAGAVADTPVTAHAKIDRCPLRMLSLLAASQVRLTSECLLFPDLSDIYRNF